MGKTALYDKKFSEYDILKFQNLQNFYIIRDGCSCDIVNDEIERFKFSDCEKYAITQGLFEMTIFLEEKSTVVTRFLSSIDYKINKNGESRHIEIFANSKKIYERVV